MIAIIAILAAMLLPALARTQQKATQINCLSNLKQLGHALQMYADDHGDQLPGPLWNGMQASFDGNSSEEILFDLYPDLGIPAPSDVPTVARVAVCPGYMKSAPGINSLSDMEGRICYLLNPNVSPLPGTRVGPFGYPSPPQMPLKQSQLSRYGSPAELFAVTDVDKCNVTDPSVSWWGDLPYAPVHGSTRDRLCFDGHAGMVKTPIVTTRK